MSAKTASYELKFKDYEITQARSMDGFLVVSGGGECDLVSAEVAEFVFADCVKSFDELVAASQPSSFKRLFKFDDISVTKMPAEWLKITIEGYDESCDNVKFDISGLNLKEPYRYAISNNSFEMSLNLDDLSGQAELFLAAFEYGCGGSLAREPKVKIYIDENLVYEKICK